MIVGLGIDVCSEARIAEILDRHGALFADRVFTPREIEHAGCGVVRNQRLAARWAAKEAAIKALGAPDGLRWHDLEVVNDAGGAPSLRLAGAARACADGMGVARALLSLSHAAGFAVAVVVLEGGDHVDG